MEEEKKAIVKIGNKEYELILTTKATRAISKKFGGLTNLGKRLEDNSNVDEGLEDAIFLITLLANQSILKDNYENGKNEPLLTEDQVELLTKPVDFVDFKDAILLALLNGTKREVVSEDTEKND